LLTVLAKNELESVIFRIFENEIEDRPYPGKPP